MRKKRFVLADRAASCLPDTPDLRIECPTCPLRPLSDAASLREDEDENCFFSVIIVVDGDKLIIDLEGARITGKLAKGSQYRLGVEKF